MKGDYAGLTAIVMVLMIVFMAPPQMPKPEPKVVPREQVPVPQPRPNFEKAWQEAVPMRIVTTDRSPLEPRPVVTERIVRPPQVTVLKTVPDEPVANVRSESARSELHESAVKPRARARIIMRNSSLCERHGMRKVETRGGKSWRCRK